LQHNNEGVRVPGGFFVGMDRFIFAAYSALLFLYISRLFQIYSVESPNKFQQNTRNNQQFSTKEDQQSTVFNKNC
jgi:hypothetical protein